MSTTLEGPSRFSRLVARAVLAAALVSVACDNHCACADEEDCLVEHQCTVPTSNDLCTYNITFVQATSYDAICAVETAQPTTISVRGNSQDEVTFLEGCVNVVSVTSKFTGTGIPCFP